MIRTSGICLWPRPEARGRFGRRTLGYTRGRRRSRSLGQKQRPVTRSVTLDVVLFDGIGGAAEFPVATARPREPRARLIALVGELERWLAARWQWLRPRSVPCAVAALGMIAVLAAANYLAHYENDGWCPAHGRVIHVDLADR